MNLNKVKDALIEWGKENDPEKEAKTHYDLWCSMNRLICEHFGTDWLEHEQRGYKGKMFNIRHVGEDNTYRVDTIGSKFYFKADELMEELRNAISHIAIMKQSERA